jgi:hypothetical protein
MVPGYKVSVFLIVGDDRIANTFDRRNSATCPCYRGKKINITPVPFLYSSIVDMGSEEPPSR